MDASNRGLELPEVLSLALRRWGVRVDRRRQLCIQKDKEWLEHGTVTPMRVEDLCGPNGNAVGLRRCRPGWAARRLPLSKLGLMRVSLLRAAGVVTSRR